MTNYIMPTSSDLPPIRVFFEELGNVHGAYGAKGIGELPMDGPAPAIINAVEDALGVRFDFIPLLPEDIMDALDRDAPAVSSQVNGANPAGGRR
jgi:CO/xanthine dehydrogenase Mo-binding subunit